LEQKEVSFKEANRMMWIVKGSLIPDNWSQKDIDSMRESYFKRLWYNEEAYIYEEGFEDAYRTKYGSDRFS
tara:strand:+ start:460 stop:672 length:213 start_codon:yes stop_codon:yes gene_type:complete